ncbi:MAG: NADH-ubiquinone oxidoreductase-F iron-sulfur binding region domain-containing protein [Chloroflexota bacterium]
MTGLLQTPADWPSVLLSRVHGAKSGAAGKTIAETVSRDGFEGLRRAIRELGPAGIVAAIGEAGLRGRGGGGYRTADKWAAAAASEAPARYVVANGYGADPASTTDRTLMELDPIGVVEGTAIAAWAIGAEEAFIAVRAEATEAIQALEGVLRAARDAGFLGDDAFGSGRRVEIEVRPLQGAFMLGEETVLLKALDGKRGQPEQRPPHPATDGLRGMPTVVQNVQTLAAASWIVRKGARSFRAVGLPEAPGTILVQVRGAETAGIAEVPLGTPLRAIAALAGGGKGRKTKAVLVGGPSGGILPAAALGTPYTFDAIRAAGAHIGSGSVVVADDRACVVDLARVLTRYCADEACGKTIPCRIGTRRLAEITERLADGTSRAGDLGLAVDLSADIVGSALCDHERLATLPLMSGLRYFRDEIDAHLEQGICPAGVCRPISLAAAAGTKPGTGTKPSPGTTPTPSPAH